MSIFSLIRDESSFLNRRISNIDALKFLDIQENTNTYSLLSKDFILTLGMTKSVGNEMKSGMYLLNTLSTLESRYGISTEEFIEEESSRSRKLNKITPKDVETWSRYSFLYND